jgi:hypothetical protein
LDEEWGGVRGNVEAGNDGRRVKGEKGGVREFECEGGERRVKWDRWGVKGDWRGRKGDSLRAGGVWSEGGMGEG